MNPVVFVIGSLAVGAIAALLSGFLPMSGKAALGISLLPITGLACAFVFC